jgi:hypothetical protein
MLLFHGRQADHYPCATAIPIRRFYSAAVLLHNGSTDSQTESRTGNVTLTPASLELCEQPIRIACRQAWTVILNDDTELPILCAGSNQDSRSVRRMLRRVFEQVREHLREQDCVDVYCRKISRQIDSNDSTTEPGFNPAERQADEIIQRLPLAMQRDLPRFESHQIQHV